MWGRGGGRPGRRMREENEGGLPPIPFSGPLTTACVLLRATQKAGALCSPWDAGVYLGRLKNAQLPGGRAGPSQACRTLPSLLPPEYKLDPALALLMPARWPGHMDRGGAGGTDGRKAMALTSLGPTLLLTTGLTSRGAVRKHCSFCLFCF